MKKMHFILVPSKSSSPLPTASCPVSAITEEQYHQLCKFADLRLKRLRASPRAQDALAGLTGSDLVHEAIKLVLQDDAKPGSGRKLTAANRKSTASLLNRLRGIINSLISHAVARFPHSPLGDPETEPGTVELADPQDLGALLERRDLQREFFARLKLVLANEPSLTPVVLHWQQHFYETPFIASLEFDRNLTHRVRLHARRVLREMAPDFGIKLPSQGLEIT